MKDLCEFNDRAYHVEAKIKGTDEIIEGAVKMFFNPKTNVRAYLMLFKDKKGNPAIAEIDISTVMGVKWI